MGWVFIVVGVLFAGAGAWVGYSDFYIKNKGWIVIICTISAVFLVPFGFHILHKPKPFLRGVLDAVSVDPQKNFTINLGTNSLITNYNSLVNGFDMKRFINYGYDYPIKIKVDRGKLFVTVWIIDNEGKMVAQIANNEWQVNPNNFYDRNFSNMALEIIDNTKTPILQIIIKSGNEIDIGGVFYYPGGRVAATSRSFITNPSDSIIKKEMKRFFKYPGDKYLGVRN